MAFLYKDVKDKFKYSELKVAFLYKDVKDKFKYNELAKGGLLIQRR